MSNEIATLVQQTPDEKNARIASLERVLQHLRDNAGGDSCADFALRNADPERQLAAAQKRSSELFDELGIAENAAQMQIGELTRQLAELKRGETITGHVHLGVVGNMLKNGRVCSLREDAVDCTHCYCVTHALVRRITELERQLAEITADRDNLRGMIEASDAGPLFERLDAQHLRIAELEYKLSVTTDLYHACVKAKDKLLHQQQRVRSELTAEQRERIAVNARGKALISHGCGCDDCLKSINVQLELAVLAAIAEVCGPITEEA